MENDALDAPDATAATVEGQEYEVMHQTQQVVCQLGVEKQRTIR